MVANINKDRKTDEKIEQEVAAYLDEYFYSNPLFWSAIRTKTRKKQVKGSDIVITIPSKRILDGVVDEKAAINYVNKELNTYALEISSIDRGGNQMLGWLMSADSITEYYLFQWIKADVESWRDITKDNITEIEVMLVPKRAICNLLKTKGLSYKKILEINREIRAGRGIQYQVKGNKWYKFSLSTRKPVEKPINIVIDKLVYKKLAILHTFVRPKEVPKELLESGLWK